MGTNASYWTKGRLWPIDPDGYILNDAGPANLVPPYRAAVEAVRDVYRARLSGELHSSYVIGSVARGLAVAGLSDLDTIAVTWGDPEALDLSWQDAADAEITRRHPCVLRVQFEMVPLEQLVGSRRFDISAFTIKTQGVCVAGEDLAPRLPDYRPDEVVANDNVVQMRPDIEEAIRELRATSDARQVTYWCRRIMKNIIRTGFGLLMVERGVYTSDIAPCYKAFAARWPSRAAEMRRAVDWVREPTADAGEIIAYLESFGRWMIERSDEWLDRYNPARELALPLKR